MRYQRIVRATLFLTALGAFASVGSVNATTSLPCVGDCQMSCTVSTLDIRLALNIFLGADTTHTCTGVSESDSLAFRQALNNFLNQMCPMPCIPATPTTTVTPGGATETPTPTSTPGAPTSTPTTSSGGGLGIRGFVVTRRPSGATSEFYTSALAGFGVSTDPWLPATLELQAGQPDASGVASLVVAQDVIIGWTIIDTSVACTKIFAAGSSGSVACNGGVAQSVSVTQDSNGDQPPSPPVIMTHIGDPSPAGSAFLMVTQTMVQNLPAGSAVTDCMTLDYSANQQTELYTSDMATATVLNPVQGGSNPTITKQGMPFDCSNWTTSTAGQLVSPIVGFDESPVGDVANILLLSN